MNTMLAPRFSHLHPSKVPWDGLAGVTLGLILWTGLTLGTAAAQDVAAVPAASGETLQSLLGRIAPAAAAFTPPPRVTIEQAPLLEHERTLVTPNGLDMYGRPLVELGGVTYRWWVTRGAANFGVGFGTQGYLVPPAEAGGAQSLAYGSSVLTFGWRYNVDNHAAVFADASGARRFDADTTDRYRTKVGVEWKARSNKLGLDGVSRSVALQLDSGYKMSLRVRKNGVGIFVKGQF